MAFCTNCGSKIDDGARFCPDCGSPVVPERLRQSRGKRKRRIRNKNQ